MGKWAKIFWLVSGVSLALLVITRYILGGWTTDLLFIPLGLFVAAAIAALAVDYKYYIEFFTLRTTKHGMNMGAMIVLVITLLFAVNYFGKRFGQTFDLTEEKLHSLSDQSKQLLDNVDGDIQLIAFYRGAKDAKGKADLKQAITMFKDYSAKVKLRFVDAYVENEMANEYLKGQSEADKIVLFAEYKGKRVRVADPHNEQNVTSAVIKATRAGQKTIYFVVGHGERELNSADQQGLAQFKKSLEDASYIVKELNLMANPVVPTDADVVAIIGPTLQLVEGEKNALLDYARKGGRLFVAADPGQRHNIADLAKEFGVEYKDNYILDLGLNQLLGRGVAGILGLDFDKNNEITKKFVGRQQGYTIFDQVQEVTAAAEKPEGVTVSEIVKSAPSSFVVKELKNVKRPTERNSHSMVVVAEGELPSKEDGGKAAKNESFAAVFFGDSDFVAQKDIVYGLNIDIAMNTIAYLAKETDLISIAPKAPKGTELILTQTKSNIMVVSGIAVPFLFMILSGIMWYRRRNA